ncbi:MAG: YggS family pyridoxal phosphate-dependent enzyme [Thermoguttaceae bacterium]
MSDLTARIAENVAEVRRRIAEAASRSGRAADAITLVAVTKYVGPSEVRAVVEAGCTVLGESRPQQFCPKAEALDDLAVDWHMIGHLQRNKVRRTLPLVSMVQSADSRRLIEAIDRVAGELGLRMPVLIEVNISGETAKHGFAPDEVEPLLEELPGLSHVDVRGLMGMASLQGGPDTARRDFAAMRQLGDRLRKNRPPGITLDELSIGMSRDYETAIEEGATIVRVGSALYEGIPR